MIFDSQPGTSRGATTETTNDRSKLNTKGPEKWDKSTPICRFYKEGKCKFGQKCRNPHPKFCKKFMTNGSQRFNKNGCDNKCGKPHPNVCRNALKFNACNMEECRFYHMKDTMRGQDNSVRSKKKTDKGKRSPRSTPGK